MQAKIDARHHSRELIKYVFQTTDHFPKGDPEQLRPQLRKKALEISSFLSHGTSKSDQEEQNQNFMIVMEELREVLKLITIANHLGYANPQQKLLIRTAISNVINALDNIVIAQNKGN
ncbi:MAG: four helix bundle protein [Crocinitomicaceae bacterium]